MHVKLILATCITCLTGLAGTHTWTFNEDGKIIFSSGSAMSFAKGGRIDAQFLRADGTNVFLLVENSQGQVPLASLSEADRAYVAKAKDTPIDQAKVGAAELR